MSHDPWEPPVCTPTAQMWGQKTIALSVSCYGIRLMYISKMIFQKECCLLVYKPDETENVTS